MSYCCFGNRKASRDRGSGVRELLPQKNFTCFSIRQLNAATNHFSSEHRIGRGGFGTVYKGMVRNGQDVAIKVLSAESNQGMKEFLSEIDAISNIKHPNLVELVGFCVQGEHRILVYEYLENRSLDRILFGRSADQPIFSWDMRSAICIGVARGLAYLHEELEPHIVHRDIKASNILLDRDYMPKIGDFGLAKLFPDNISHITTRVAGTVGYLAPEYSWHGQLTKKADIYSFGVLVLEIVSGKSSSRDIWSEEKFLLERAWELYQKERLQELIDPSMGEHPQHEALRFMKVALFCTQAAAVRRPSMPQVVEMLSRPIRLNEAELTPPGFVGDRQPRTPDRLKESTEGTIADSILDATVSNMSPR